jgi:molybdopterin converting factor small subunit
MSESIEAVRMYTQAYHELHGRMPDIRTNNGWIKLPNGNSYRPFEIREMASTLRRRAREEELEIRWETEEDESSVWDVRDELKTRVREQIKEELKQVVLDDNNESHVQLSGWRKHIRKDTMVMFFNRLFERAGNSAFDMQRMMDDFVHNGRFSDESNCGNCEIIEELEYLKEDYAEKEEQNISFHHRLRNKQREINELQTVISELRKEMKELKKNSVIFSMDEF